MVAEVKIYNKYKKLKVKKFPRAQFKEEFQKEREGNKIGTTVQAVQCLKQQDYEKQKTEIEYFVFVT